MYIGLILRNICANNISFFTRLTNDVLYFKQKDKDGAVSRLEFSAGSTAEACTTSEAPKASSETTAAAARSATEASDVESAIVAAFPRIVLVSASFLFRCFLGCLAQHGRDGFAAMAVEPDGKETNG